MNAPKISLAAITGNCQDYVERFIRSFAPVADEIVLVRAIGSLTPDATLDIAGKVCAELGKKLVTGEYKNQPGHDWPHVDSFAAARNTSFDLASGEYIFWCDADDVLEQGADIVRQIADRGGYPAVIAPYKIFARGVTVSRVRLMSKGSGRWAHPVHEDFKFHIEPVQAIEDQRIVVTHLPNFATKKGSNTRNLTILRSIPDKEMTCGLHFHLHGELAAVGDIEGSIAAAKKALASPDIGKAEKYEIFLNFAQLAKKPAEKEAFLHEAYKADPTRREALGLLVNNALNHHRNELALAYARQMKATQPPLSAEWNDRAAVYSWVGDDLYAQALRANGLAVEAEKVRSDALTAAGGPRIALIHATRDRPEQAALARKLWLDLAERPDRVEHIFVYDADDAESCEWLARFHHLCIPAGGGCVAAWNAGAFATTAPVLVQLSDDWTPPARWDALILDRLGDLSKPSVLAVSDGLRQDALLCMLICTRPYFFLDYFLFHPLFKGVYSDNWATELAYRRGAVIEARDLVFTHDHPLKTGKPADAVYAAQNSPQAYHEGKAILEYLQKGNDWSSVPGWFDYHGFYERIARGLNDADQVAEVGVWLGRSLIYLAQACQRLGKDVHFFAVDHFRGEKDQPEHKRVVDAHGGSIRDAFESNLQRCGVADRVQVIEGDSAASAAKVPDGSLAFAFIDAAHDGDSVLADIKAWRPKVKPGGILAGHDALFEPVERAVNSVFGKVHRSGSVWWKQF